MQAVALETEARAKTNLVTLTESLEKLKRKIEEAVMYPNRPLPTDDPTLAAIRRIYPQLEATLVALIKASL